MNSQTDHRKARRFWVAPLVGFVIGVSLVPLLWPAIRSVFKSYITSRFLGVPPLSVAFNDPLSWKIIVWANEEAFSLSLWPLWILNGAIFAGTTFAFLMLCDLWHRARAQ